MASRFWVGGTGNWDASTTTNWSTTTGGGGGASVPTSSDNVTFDSNSGASATVTITAPANANSITINKSDITLLDNSGITVVGAITLTTGTLNTNGQTESWGSLVSSNSNTRTLTLGSSAISVSLAGLCWECDTATNLTITANSATLTCTGSGARFRPGFTKNWNGLSVVMNGGGTAQVELSAAGGACTLANFTCTGTNSKTDILQITNIHGITCTGGMTLTGNTITNRLLVSASPVGTAATLSAASITITNADFRDITGAGLPANAAWTGASGSPLGDALGNSNITFTTPTTRYAVVAGNWSDTATWSATDGGTGGVSVPLPQDNVFLNANSAGNVTIDMPRTAADINCTGFTHGLTFGINSTLYGSFTFFASMGLTNTTGITFGGRSAKTLTAATRTPPSIGITMPGGTLTLQDNITVGGSLTLTQGTLDAAANNVNVTTNSFASAGSIRRDLKMGSGTWNIKGTGVVISVANWGAGGGVWNSGTSTVVISDVSSSSKTITPGGSAITYYNFSITGGGTGAILWNNGSGQIFQCSGTLTIGAPKTVTFVNGFTYTVGGFAALGSSGNIITINSDSPGVAANLSQANGINSCDYMSITDSHAIGGAAWYAGANSSDGGGNTGWVFTAPPATRIYSTEMMMGI